MHACKKTKGTHLVLSRLQLVGTVKNIKLPPVPPPIPFFALSVLLFNIIVPPKGLAEAQGVIFYFLIDRYTFPEKLPMSHSCNTMRHIRILTTKFLLQLY